MPATKGSIQCPQCRRQAPHLVINGSTQNCPCGTCKAQIPRPWCKSETWKDDLDKKNKNYITLNNGICISLQQHSIPASKLLKGVQRYLPFVNSQYPQTLRKYRTIPYRTFPHLALTYQPDSVQPLPEMCLEDWNGNTTRQNCDWQEPYWRGYWADHNAKVQLFSCSCSKNGRKYGLTCHICCQHPTLQLADLLS